jgi:acetyl esterase/lipase
VPFSTSDEKSALARGVAAEIGLLLPEEALLVKPLEPVRVGVLVLLGSSGRMDVDRAHLLAQHGAHALALRWFGGNDQSPGVCEIPLETFVRALDRLQEEDVERLAVIGLSKGAEAAMLLACIDDRPSLTVAMSPTSVVWANVGAGVDGRVTPYRSSWTWHGEPLPYVSYDESWTPQETDGPIAYRSLYEQSLRLDPDASEAAAIPVEQADSELVLVAGHEDALWPSVDFAQALAARRVAQGKQVELILHEHAGHSPIFPGQQAPPMSHRIKPGGTPEGDAELGEAMWAALVQRLGLS